MSHEITLETGESSTQVFQETEDGTTSHPTSERPQEVTEEIALPVTSEMDVPRARARYSRRLKQTLPRKRRVIRRDIKEFMSTCHDIIRLLKSLEISVLNVLMLIVLCTISMLLEPLFLYTPVTNDEKKCFILGENPGVFAYLLRTFMDGLYIFIAIMHWLDFFAPDENEIKQDLIFFSSATLRMQDIDIPENEFKRGLFFLIDIFIVLPIPQVAWSLVLDHRINAMKFWWAMKFLIGQHVLRVLRLYTLLHNAKISIKHAIWAIVVFVLFYFHAGNVIGAAWYFFAIKRKIECWRTACMSQSGCDNHSFYCGDSSRNYTFANDFCSRDAQNTSTFDFRIFQDAIHSGVVSEVNFSRRFVACLRWGIQNLSFLGQGLTLSTNVSENLFALAITIIGVVLFFFTIGKVQMYIQAESEKSEKTRQKIVEMSRWPLYKRLNPWVQELIMTSGIHKWPETRSVDVEYLVNNLPKRVKSFAKWNLCRKLLDKVERFRNWDAFWFDLCDHMKPVVYTQSSYMVKENAPIDRMVFVLKGNFWPSNSPVGIESPSKALRLQKYLQDGVFWENEIFDWMEQERAGSGSSKFNISPVNIQARTKVEAFFLMAEDLKKFYERYLAVQAE